MFLFLLQECKRLHLLGTFSSSFIGDPVLSPMVGYEHSPLYLSGSGRASQETAISSSFQQALVGIHYSVWVWWLCMWWIPRWGSLWMILPSGSAANVVSITPSMGILFPILRSNEVSTHLSSLFLIFWCIANCILGICCVMNICLF